MITTSNLGLTVWDSEEDDFEHSQLANNFVRIDDHSHEGALSAPLEPAGPRGETAGHWTSLGLGLPISTFAIKPGAIWRYLIADRAVGHLQIDKEGVESENIAKKNVLNAHVDDEAIDDRTILHETITIDKLDPNILKLGSVILWYKATPGEQPGDIWAICDGRAWGEVPNAWGLTEGRIPDLRERFVRGTDLAHIGETGGSASIKLEHHHNVSSSALNHSHVVPGHNHVIVPDGLHHHTFAGGYQIGTRKNAFVNDLVLEGHHNDLQSAYLQEFNEGGESASASMDQGGMHSHGGTTGLSAAFGTGGSSLSGSVSTDTQLTNVSTMPPYTGLVYLMRVQ